MTKLGPAIRNALRLLLVAFPSSGSAAELANATCDISVNGASFIVGSCVASFEDGILILGSSQVGKGTGLPLSSFRVDFDVDNKNVVMAMYNTLDMSRFAGLDLSGAQGDISPMGGCLNASSFSACFNLDGENNAKITPADVFQSSSDKIRKAAQQKLQEYGYYQGALDGEWGAGTEQAFNALYEISHAFAFVDPESYWFDFTEHGMRKFMADMEVNKVERLVGVYSFCDNIDGHMLDVAQRQGKKMRDVVSQAYLPVAEKWCPLLFIEGD